MADTISRRPTATARCAFCRWSVQFTDDSWHVVGEFLRAQLIAHVEADHLGAIPHDQIDIQKRGTR